MTAKIEAKKEIHYRCKKCLPAEALAKEGGDEIYWNTHKSMTYCKCKALGVDGCEFYACPVVSFAVLPGCG